MFGHIQVLFEAESKKEWKHFKYLILGNYIIHRKQILKQNMPLIPVTPKILDYMMKIQAGETKEEKVGFV